MLRHPLSRALGSLAGYMACVWAARLVFLTFVAYTLARLPGAPAAPLQKIGDVARANQALVHGLAAALFVILLRLLHPLTRTQPREIFDLAALRGKFAPNALGGLILTAVLVLGAMLGGHMSYFGAYMSLDEVAFSLAAAGLFSAALFLLAIAEEFLLRRGLEPALAIVAGPVPAAAVSCAAFLAIRGMQFELGWLEAANLILLNLILSRVARRENSHMASASFEGAFLVLTHVVFGLPLMGQDMPGILLLRPVGNDALGSLLTGGPAGPEGGLVLTVLLIIRLYLPIDRFHSARDSG